MPPKKRPKKGCITFAALAFVLMTLNACNHPGNDPGTPAVPQPADTKHVG